MLLRLVALLLLGLGIALVVAWAPATFVLPTRQAIGASQALQPRWDVEVQEGFSTTVVVFENKYLRWVRAPRPGASDLELEHWVVQRQALERNEPPPEYYEPAKHVIAMPYWTRASSLPTRTDRDVQFIDRAQGWPFRCVVGHWRQKASTPGQDISQWTLQIPILQAALPAGLPFRPIWTGIVANTLLNVVLICLLLASVRICRRWIRRRRGLCHICRYPVGSSVTCTECGATLCAIRAA